MYKTLTLATFLSATALFAHPAHAANCTPARMLMVLDKSSSMLDAVDSSGTSKWSIAHSAISQIANTYQNKIDLGINIFPDPNQCSPGKTKVEPGPGNASAIINALGSPPPTGGNYTPMAQSIDVAAANASLQDASRRPAILLITDGWQWCSPYDPATRTWPVDAVAAAKQKGIKVYVVGFGAAVDVSTMNKMALAAGTSLPGCNPNSTSTQGANCYYQADSSAQLIAALNAISVTVSAEICNGLDDDCDGQIDEGLSRGCSSACGAGTQVCNAGTWSSCNAPAPQNEICDSKDNDCDGQIDEGCGCTPGQTIVCGAFGQGACAQTGTQTCQPNGQWGPCTGAGNSSPEICNGIDDDCDGMIDNAPNDQLCPQGGYCGDDDKCHAVTETPPQQQSTPPTCEQSGGCGQQCTPSGAEKCNLIDDDCDGIVDNGDAPGLCPGGWVCGDDGRCRNGEGVVDQAGCGCVLGGQGPAPGAPLLVLVLGALVYLARRRRAA